MYKQIALLIFSAFAVLSTTFASTQIYPLGDLDRDYQVGVEDLVIFAEQWLDESGCVPPNCAELDGLSRVDLYDFSLVAASWLDNFGPPLVINELMASNNSASGISDPQGDFDDWIEIHNYGDQAVNLSGMYLSDDLDDAEEWRFPTDRPAETTIDPNGFIIVWADGDEGQTSGLHAGFQLDSDGEEIALFDTDGELLIDGFSFDRQISNVTYGRWPDGDDDLRFFAVATPAAPNNSAYLGVIDDTNFSHNRGFYEAPFNLTITCTTPDAEIYYTTDGSAPIENELPSSTGIHYTGSLTINSNTCVRAAAIKTGFRPTNIDTHTYIFNASDAIKSLPVYSVVGDEGKSLFEPDGVMAIVGGYYQSDGSWQSSGSGSYNNPIHRGIDYERPVSFEIIDAQTGQSCQADCGIRVAGSNYHRPRYTRGDNWDWNYDKFSLKLFFRSDLYGDKELDYPAFPMADTDKFESLILRGGHNDVRNPFIKDEMLRRLHKDMGGVSVTGTVANFYINGEFKSFYNPCERLDDDFFRNYYDVDTDWDVITQRAARNGDYVAWNSTLNFCRYTDLSNTTNYTQAGEMIDIVDFIDYLIIQLYSANWDWPANNWTVSRERTPEGKFRFHTWDMEGTMESGWINGFGFDDFPSWGPGGLNGLETQLAWIYRGLKANSEFKVLFADRIQKHFFYDGALVPAHLEQRYTELRQQMAQVLPDMDTSILTYWIPNRHQIMLDKFTDEALFPSPGPDFQVNGVSQHGGSIASTDTMTIVETGPSGTVYYTTDGTDPRVSADDSQAGSELVLVTEAASKKVLVPTEPLTGGTGSITVEYWQGISGTSVSDLTNNANYPDNPDSTGSLTRFEIPVDSMENYGTRIRGYLHPPSSGDYTFWISSDDSSQLWLSSNDEPGNAGQIAYVDGWTNSREWNKFASQKSASISLTAGQTYYIEALHKEGNYGDNLAVAWEGPGFSQEVIEGSHLSPFVRGWTAVNYDDTSWTSGVGGVGYENAPSDSVNYSSLIDTDIQTAMYTVNSTCYIRIPFTVSLGDLDVLTSLSLNIRYDDGFVAYINGVEVAADYADSNPAWDSVSSGQRDDSVCVNVSSIDISSHIGNLAAGNNVLSIHGMNGSADSPDFLITAELVATKSNAGSVAPTAIEYAGGFNLGQSAVIQSRVLLPSGLWSALHEASYSVGPVAENLRITEIMYHPADPNTEFIELQNIGTQTINPRLVTFTNGIDFTFPSLTLDPGAYALVVENLGEFRKQYGTGLNDFIAGEYTGGLDNAGEKIKLTDAAGQTIHKFDYKDGWYDMTDGDGFSLTIINPHASDPNLWDDKDGWRPSAVVGGSPGTTDTGMLPEPGSIVINEVLAHSHATAPDWIELYNTTESTINIGGWFLSDSNDDDPNIMKYEIPLGMSIPGGGYKVFYEDLTFGDPSAEGVNTAFGLSEGGDSVYLRSGAGGVIGGYEASESFGASASNIAFGRHIKSVLDGGVNFVAMSANTPGWANVYPKVGPVVISEIMYNPDAANTGGEYIELYNITGAAVPLEDVVSTETSQGVFTTETVPWHFSDGIDFVFPSGTTIPANGYVIIAQDPTAFTAYHGAMPNGVDVLGPFENDTKLSNGGEQIQIVRPGDQEYGGDRYWIRTERVTYDDTAPWPVEADGAGDALHQKTPDTAGSNYGNDVINWMADTPSPGQ